MEAEHKASDVPKPVTEEITKNVKPISSPSCINETEHEEIKNKIKELAYFKTLLEDQSVKFWAERKQMQEENKEERLMKDLALKKVEELKTIIEKHNQEKTANDQKLIKE